MQTEYRTDIAVLAAEDAKCHKANVQWMVGLGCIPQTVVSPLLIELRSSVGSLPSGLIRTLRVSNQRNRDAPVGLWIAAVVLITAVLGIVINLSVASFGSFG